MSVNPEFDDSDNRKRPDEGFPRPDSEPENTGAGHRPFPAAPPRPPHSERAEPTATEQGYFPTPPQRDASGRFLPHGESGQPAAPSYGDEGHSRPHQYPQPAPVTPGGYPETAEDKTWSSIAHIIPLAAMWLSAGFLGFVASIIVFIMGKEKSPFIRNYAAQALNIQLNALLWFIVSWILVIVLIGVIMLPLVAIWATVLHVLAIAKANQGHVWKPPFTIQFVK